MNRREIIPHNRVQLGRFFRWAFTGTVTVALDILIFRTLYPNLNSVLLSNAISMPIVTSFNYLMHHKWSFESSRSHSAATPRFLVSLAVGFLLNSVIVKVALMVGATPALAKLSAVPIQAPINFAILNRWVFHTRDLL